MEPFSSLWSLLCDATTAKKCHIHTTEKEVRSSSSISPTASLSLKLAVLKSSCFCAWAKSIMLHYYQRFGGLLHYQNFSYKLSFGLKLDTWRRNATEGFDWIAKVCMNRMQSQLSATTTAAKLLSAVTRFVYFLSLHVSRGCKGNKRHDILWIRPKKI